MKKIAISIFIISAVSIITIGSTFAFLSDTEKSDGNTFAAGALDLKVDSQGHYRDMVCVDGYWEPENPVICDDSAYNQNECSASGTAEKAPDSALLDNGTIVTAKVQKSDNIRAYQYVSGAKYIYLNWNFNNLPDNIPMILAELKLEHRENNVLMDVEWLNGANWVQVCDPPEASSDTLYTCDLLQFLDNTDKAKNIQMRLRLKRAGHCHEELDWANLKLKWFKDGECGECGNCVLEDGEECDGSLGVPDGYLCTDKCKLIKKQPCESTWKENDLNTGAYKFFNFSGLRPGDYGEDTISLHVYNNDAWGKININNIIDKENTCTEPEKIDEPDCAVPGEGELRKKILFTAWLDQGSMPGFQNGHSEPGATKCCQENCYDYEEGDNIRQAGEPLIMDSQVISLDGETIDLKSVLAKAWSQYCQNADINGQDNYGFCHGIAQDGRLVGDIDYYVGLGWEFPDERDNSTQSDSFAFDMNLEIEQYRHNSQ